MTFGFFIFEDVSDLEFSNVTQLKVHFPSYIPAMRVHFDTRDIFRYLSRWNDYDLVMSHLEHTHQLKNLLYNKTHLT